MKIKHEFQRRLDRSFRLGLIDRRCMELAKVSHERSCEYLDDPVAGTCDCDCRVTLTAKGGTVFIVRENGHLAIAGEGLQNAQG